MGMSTTRLFVLDKVTFLQEEMLVSSCIVFQNVRVHVRLFGRVIAVIVVVVVVVVSCVILRVAVHDRRSIFIQRYTIY